MNKFKYSYGRQANITLPSLEVPTISEAEDFVKGFSIRQLRDSMMDNLDLSWLDAEMPNKGETYGLVLLSELFDTRNGVASSGIKRLHYKKNDNFYGGSTKKNTTKTSKRTSSKNSAATATKPWAPKPERTPRTPAYRKTGANNINRKKSDFIQKTKATRAGWYDEVMIPTLPRNMTRTENGAIAYATTGKALLDLNYQISTMRQWDENKIVSAWRKAYSENPRLAIRWLGYLRSVREGQGERRTFRIIIQDMANNGGDQIISNLVPILGELGRYDDLWVLLDTPCKNTVLEYTKNKLYSDIKIFRRNKNVI